MEFHNHDLVPDYEFTDILYERRPVLGADGNPVEGLHNIWILLNNPTQLNSYTTKAVKEVILAFRKASNDRACACVVFTAVGSRSFCTGGNTKEYAEYYAGDPEEYRQYMRLFNDMVSGILHCDKPVICRVNGMRLAGGQEIGMACDFTVAQDMARFGQAGPKHGSAPDGGSTDFLPLFVGMEQSMLSVAACVPWSAHKAMNLGLITECVPALKVDGEWVANPMVHLDGYDAYGRPRHGEYKTGADRNAAKGLLKAGELDLSLLDEAVDRLATTLLLTFPGCVSKSIESLRKHKLDHWNRNKESNRSWLGLNMMTEANAGFRTFNSGERHEREIDFADLRRRLAQGEKWNEDLIRAVGTKAMKEGRG